MTDDVQNSGSLPEITHLAARDVLRDGVKEYEREFALLRENIVRLNTAVAILESIDDYLSSHDVQGIYPFYWFVGSALYDNAVLVAWRIWSDTDPSSINLRHLRNFVFRNLRDEYRPILRERFRSLQPVDDCAPTVDRIENVRNGHLGHLDRVRSFARSVASRGPNFAELRQLTDRLTAYFKALSFGVTPPLIDHSMLRAAEHVLGTARAVGTNRHASALWEAMVNTQNAISETQR